jgi:hypothetical protein
VFNGDKFQWKIRHEYSAGVITHRAAAKATVAG